MTTILIVLSVIAVAAVCAAIVFCVFYIRAKGDADRRVMQAENEGELKLREAESAGELKLREAEGKLRETVAAGGAELKAKDDYIAKIEALHSEAVKKSDEVHAEAIRKLEANHAEAVKKSDEIHAEAMKKVEEQHAKDMKLMQEQFRTAAAEILDKNSEAFSKQSSEKINVLLKPVNEKFEEFRKKVEESDLGRVKMQTSIEEQIRAMIDQSTKVGESADNLANALTFNPKSQGDFGEMLLRDILLNAGLIEDIHFKCQGVMTDEVGHEIKGSEGQTLIPDVLVFYPDGTTVVVDSKISLTDYVRYCSETTEEGKHAALKAHIESIRKHINELAVKDYASYIPEGKRKVDFNIMFIPNDGAFLLMMDDSPRLWHEARERNVLIVSQMTLVVVLNMIQLVWKQSEREKNVEAVVNAAAELMTQLQGWLHIYEDIGVKIDKLSSTYSDATKKLTDSNQSVVQKIRKLERLGAAPKHKAVKGSGRLTGATPVIPSTLSGDFPELEADEQ